MTDNERHIIQNELTQTLTYLGKRLKYFREMRGYTQTEIHHRTGIAKSTISDLENGRCKDPKLSTIIALTIAYDVDLSILTMKQSFIEEENDIKAFRNAFDTLNKIYEKIK